MNRIISYRCDVCGRAIKVATIAEEVMPVAGTLDNALDQLVQDAIVTRSISEVQRIVGAEGWTVTDSSCLCPEHSPT